MSTYIHPGSVMHGWSMRRRETGLLEAFCSHGIGHPIPESVRHMDARGPLGSCGAWGVHGCDGCCSGDEHSRYETLRELRLLAKSKDAERAHVDADVILLAYLDDAEIRAAWEAVPKWYA